MTLTKKFGTLSALTMALLTMQSASAQEEVFVNPEWANKAWYIGTALGQTRGNIDDAAVQRSLNRPGQTISANGWDSDEESVGFKWLVGKQLNRNFAIEGSYVDLGKFYTRTTSNQGGLLLGEHGYRGFGLDLVGMLPMTERFGVYGRIGGSYLKATQRFNGTQFAGINNRKVSDKSFNPKVGLGAEYKFNEAWALRGEVERYRVDDAFRTNGKVDMYQLALVYKLGRPAARPAPMPEPAPAPVVEAPAPAPAPMPAPAPAPQPVSEKVSFAAEALFDFDKAFVKPAGKSALDELLSKVQGMNTEVMVTVGHTDSIGSDQYNQKLSQRRAEAVKAYIVSKGVDASRVYTEGKGESQPVADNKTAEGRAKNRRVTVEVVGTRSK